MSQVNISEEAKSDHSNILQDRVSFVNFPLSLDDIHLLYSQATVGSRCRPPAGAVP